MLRPLQESVTRSQRVRSTFRASAAGRFGRSANCLGSSRRGQCRRRNDTQTHAAGLPVQVGVVRPLSRARRTVALACFCPSAVCYCYAAYARVRATQGVGIPYHKAMRIPLYNSSPTSGAGDSSRYSQPGSCGWYCNDSRSVHSRTTNPAQR